MSILIAAAVLPLIAINADDARLQARRTFVSEEARMELARDNGERVLCLDRKRDRSICLTEAQWRQAIALAEAKPKARVDFRGDVPIYFGGQGSELGGSVASANP